MRFVIFGNVLRALCRLQFDAPFQLRALRRYKKIPGTLPHVLLCLNISSGIKWEVDYKNIRDNSPATHKLDHPHRTAPWYYTLQDDLVKTASHMWKELGTDESWISRMPNGKIVCRFLWWFRPRITLRHQRGWCSPKTRREMKIERRILWRALLSLQYPGLTIRDFERVRRCTPCPLTGRNRARLV